MEIAGYEFNEPVPLGEGFECESTGAYLVLSGKKIIYVGEVNVLSRTIDSEHDKWGCFQRHKKLMIAFRPMLGSTIYWREKVREAVLEKLGEAGEPACQN